MLIECSSNSVHVIEDLEPGDLLWVCEVNLTERDTFWAVCDYDKHKGDRAEMWDRVREWTHRHIDEYWKVLPEPLIVTEGFGKAYSFKLFVEKFWGVMNVKLADGGRM